MLNKEIYIRTTGTIMTIAIKNKMRIIYRDFDIENFREPQRKLFNTILKQHETWPINIMWKDIKTIRKLGVRI